MLPDEDFWMLLTGEYAQPDVGWGNTISPRWIEWAKRTIMDVSFVPPKGGSHIPSSLEREDALAIYLCRLVRILDSMAAKPAPSRREADVLENLLLGAAHLASLEIDLCRFNVSRPGGDHPLRQAADAGMIRMEEVDLWHAGMPSGSGLTTFCTLTVLGKRKADELGPPPPYLWSEQDDLDAQAGDVEVPAAMEEHPDDPSVPPVKPAPTPPPAQPAVPGSPSPNWSRAMSKAKAASLAGVSVDKLDDYLHARPGAVIKISREVWKFDRNLPLFSGLP